MNSISLSSLPEFPGGPENDNTDSTLAPYAPPLDFGPFSTTFPLIPSPPQSTSLLDKVDSSWRGADDIEQDVEAVDSKINNLFHQLQIPTDGSAPLLDPSGSASVTDPSNPTQMDSDLFHSFLNGIGDDDEGVFGDESNTSTAFLDEASTSEGTLSPVTMFQEAESPTTGQSKTGKKRKSDAAPADVDQEQAPSTGTRAKRRRER
jgi:hypothetical protein